MSLKVWLPLNGDINNYGLKGDIDITNNGAVINDNGKIGKCYYFNSKTMILPSYDTTKSICFWLKAPKINSTIAFVDYKSKLGFGFLSNGYIIPNGSGMSLKMYDSSNYISDLWNHIAVVKNSDNTDVLLYINGILQTTRINTNNNWTNNVDGCYFGGRSTGTYMNCYINDIRIYDHCLSLKEVQEIAKGLVLHYKLDNNGMGNPNLATPSTNTTSTTSSAELKSTTFSGWDNYANLNIALTTAEWASMVGKQITYSMWMRNVSLTTGTGTGIMIHFRYADGTYQQFGGGKNGTSGSYLTLGEEGWLKLTVTVPDPSARTNPTTINYVQYSIRHNSSDGASTVEYQYAKIEKGSVATEWTPYLNQGNFIEDTSGYLRHGTIWKYDTNGNFTNNVPTPKYSTCSFIDSANNTTNTASGTVYIYGNCELIQPSALTCTFWCNPIAGYRGGTNQGLFSLTNNDIGNNASTDYLTGPMNHRDGIIDVNNAAGDTHIRPSVAFTANEWHHYAFVYDGRYAKVYKDGVQQTSADMGSTVPLGSMKGAVIGFSKAGRVWRSNKSSYSDFRLYVTALTAEQIKELYNTSASIDENGNIYAREVIE